MFTKQKSYIFCTENCNADAAIASTPKKRVWQVVIAVILALLIALSVSSPAKAATGDDIADIAKSYLGYPYAYGAAGPTHFDCSGFVWYVYNQADIDFRLRIGSNTLTSQNTRINNINDLEPGDICFFGYGSYVSHWAIYVGNGNVVHAYNSRVGVVSTHITSVRPSFIGACRINNLEPSLKLEEESSLLTDLIAKNTVQVPMKLKHEIEEQLKPFVAPE